MGYDEILAERIRQRLARCKNVEERKMFGGVGFLLNGNLLMGVWKDSLCVRLGPEQSDESLLEPQVKEFDITGRPMKGWAHRRVGGTVGATSIERPKPIARLRRSKPKSPRPGSEQPPRDGCSR